MTHKLLFLPHISSQTFPPSSVFSPRSTPQFTGGHLQEVSSGWAVRWASSPLESNQPLITALALHLGLPFHPTRFGEVTLSVPDTRRIWTRAAFQASCLHWGSHPSEATPSRLQGREWVEYVTQTGSSICNSMWALRKIAPIRRGFCESLTAGRQIHLNNISFIKFKGYFSPNMCGPHEWRFDGRDDLNWLLRNPCYPQVAQKPGAGSAWCL